MLGVVVSEADSASVRIGERLRALVDWRPIDDPDGPDGYRAPGVERRVFADRHLDLVRPAEAFDADIDVLVFASRHAGDTGPLLTAHHTGNVGPADHGGADHELARACPNAHARVLVALDRYAPPRYDVGMEATHHGPSDVGVPSMFVEVGSDEAQWADPDAAEAVARAILDLRDVDPYRPDAPDTPDASDATAALDDSTTANAPRRNRHLVGFGGGHYAPRFERVVRETDWAVGHVVPNWGLDALGDPDTETGRAVLRQAMDRSAARYALVDDERSTLVDVLSTEGYEVVDETWVRETADVPLGFVEEVESATVPVSEGLRFGDAAAGYRGEFSVASLPADLLAETTGIDQAATREAVAATTLAFGTDQNGTRVTGPAVLADATERVAVIESLLDVLRERYDEVGREGNVVRARETAFDPELAREAGVPEGPKFGQLSAGDTVEVDGETIHPADVRRDRVREFTLD